MSSMVNISVVIPTRDRRSSLLRLLKSLNQSLLPIREVIIVDSGNEVITDLLSDFDRLSIKYTRAGRSVCVQRNVGIKMAVSEWIFLCDDDLEVPPDYLLQISEHLGKHKHAGAATGIVLQKFEGEWTGEYAVKSVYDLVFRYIFQLTVWGSIQVRSQNFLAKRIKNYYQHAGNHLSKAGWPVVTDFSGSFFRTPFYGLGASVVSKTWLENSLFDEVLDPHGIGDNYGVASSFPEEGIHVLKNIFVYHYRDSDNRLSGALIYYRRILALDYFLKTKKQLAHIKRPCFIWSLTGNALAFLFQRNFTMMRIAVKVLFKVLFGKNPYLIAHHARQKITEPQL